MSSPAPVRRVASQGPSTTAIFLVLRRMRLPLIVLISLFAISVLGLTLVPGQDIDGQPWRMDLFDAFYFMSYTATTIGFGEIPYPFSTAQRAWVIVTIYLSVVAWASGTQNPVRTATNLDPRGDSARISDSHFR